MDNIEASRHVKCRKCLPVVHCNGRNRKGIFLVMGCPRGDKKQQTDYHQGFKAGLFHEYYIYLGARIRGREDKKYLHPLCEVTEKKAMST